MFGEQYLTSLWKNMLWPLIRTILSQSNIFFKRNFEKYPLNIKLQNFVNHKIDFFPAWNKYFLFQWRPLDCLTFFLNRGYSLKHLLYEILTQLYLNIFSLIFQRHISLKHIQNWDIIFGHFFPLCFIFTPQNSKFQQLMNSNVCINLPVMHRNWKDSITQHYRPLAGTYFFMEFISKP